LLDIARNDKRVTVEHRRAQRLDAMRVRLAAVSSTNSKSFVKKQEKKNIVIIIV